MSAKWRKSGLLFLIMVIFICVALFLPDSLAVKYLAVIQAILVLALVFVTIGYAISTKDLVDESKRNREAESARDEKRREDDINKEKAKKNQFLDVLLAELKENEEILGKNKEKFEEEKFSNWYEPESIFIYPREDGFNAFRNQGGLQYLEGCKCGDNPLYNGISEYYYEQYLLCQEIKTKIALNKEKYKDHDFSGEPNNPVKKYCNGICKRVEDILEYNEALQTSISDCKKL